MLSPPFSTISRQSSLVLKSTRKPNGPRGLVEETCGRFSQFVWVVRIFLPLASPADREGGEGEKNASGLAGLVLAWRIVYDANQGAGRRRHSGHFSCFFGQNCTSRLWFVFTWQVGLNVLASKVAQRLQVHDCFHIKPRQGSCLWSPIH